MSDFEDLLQSIPEVIFGEVSRFLPIKDLSSYMRTCKRTLELCSTLVTEVDSSERIHAKLGNLVHFQRLRSIGDNIIFEISTDSIQLIEKFPLLIKVNIILTGTIESLFYLLDELNLVRKSNVNFKILIETEDDTHVAYFQGKKSLSHGQIGIKIQKLYSQFEYLDLFGSALHIVDNNFIRFLRKANISADINRLVESGIIPQYGLIIYEYYRKNNLMREDNEYITVSELMYEHFSRFSRLRSYTALEATDILLRVMTFLHLFLRTSVQRLF